MKSEVSMPRRSTQRRSAAAPPRPAVPPPSYAGAIPPHSVSEDDDDDDCSSSATPVDTHEALVEDVVKNNRADAMAYLLRYETMVRQQEAEDMAVLAHLRPCISRLLQLAGGPEPKEEDHQDFLSRQVSFSTLKRACNALEELQENSRVTEHMTTDRQLMMVLRLLTQKMVVVPGHPHDEDASITWAEIVQCYKVCIGGMLTLQHLAPGNNKDAIRARARDRTLAMLSLFEPPSTLLFHEDALAAATGNNNAAPLSSSRGATIDSRPLTATLGGVANVSRAAPVPPLANHHYYFRSNMGKKKTRRMFATISIILVVVFYAIIVKLNVFLAVHHDVVGEIEKTPPALMQLTATADEAVVFSKVKEEAPLVVLTATPKETATKKLGVKSVLQDSLWMIL